MRKNSTQKNKELSITIAWHIDDVLEVRPDLNKNQAWEVLRLVKKSHDANVGINWEVLSATAEVLFGEKRGKNE